MSPRQTTATPSYTLTQTASPLADIPSAPAQPSPPPHSVAAAIAAGTVGAIIRAIIILILVMLVLRWRKRRTEEKVLPIKLGDMLRVQCFDANGAGISFYDQGGSGKSWDYAHLYHPLPIKLSQQGASKRYRYLDDYLVIVFLSLIRYRALLVFSPAVICSGPCRYANRFA